MTALESEASEKSTSYREQLRAALAEMQAQQTKEMETAIQASLEGLLETLHAKIHETQEQSVRGGAEAVKCSAGIGHDRAGERSVGEVGVVRGATAGGARRDASAADEGDGDRRFRPAWKACWKRLRGKIHEAQRQCCGGGRRSS